MSNYQGSNLIQKGYVTLAGVMCKDRQCAISRCWSILSAKTKPVKKNYIYLV